LTQRAERGTGRAVAEEKMSDGEIRYRFKTIDEKFEGLYERLDRKDEADAKRGELTWGKIIGMATIVSTLLAAIVGAWMSTKGIAK
jgi:hypothetical protein